MPEMKIFRLGGLSGGRNTRDGRNVIDLSQSPDDLNMEWRTNGVLTRRGGFRLYLFEDFSPYVIRGAGRYIPRTGDKHILLYIGDGRVRSYAGDDYPFPEGVTRQSGLTLDDEKFFDQMNDWAYLSSGWQEDVAGDSAYRWNGTKWRLMGLPVVDTDLGMSLTPAIGAAPDAMVFDAGASLQYAYRIAYNFDELGDSSNRMKGTAVGGWAVAGPGATSVGNVALVIPLDPDATSVKIYRSLRFTNGGSASGPYYFVAEVQSGGGATVSYTDNKNDTALVVEAPDNPLFSQELFPKFKYMARHGNRMWLANCKFVSDEDEGDTILEETTAPSRLYYSDLYTADRPMGFIDVFPNDRAGGIVAIRSHEDQLVIFKATRTYVLFGSTEADFLLRLAHSSVGCVAPRAHAALENNVIFLAGDGVYAYDGANFRRISEAIRPDLDAISDSRQRSAAAEAAFGRFLLSLVK